MEVGPGRTRVGKGKPIGLRYFSAFPNQLSGTQVPPDVSVAEIETPQQKSQEQEADFPEMVGW